MTASQNARNAELHATRSKLGPGFLATTGSSERRSGPIACIVELPVNEWLFVSGHALLVDRLVHFRLA